MKSWSITDAKRNFGEVVQAAESGEPQIITRYGIPVAAIIKYMDYDTDRTPYDDPRFSGITYRTGQSGIPTPIIRGTEIRVQTVVVVCPRMGNSVEDFAKDHEITEGLVVEALAYYSFHRDEVDTLIQMEKIMEERFRHIEMTPDFSRQVDEFIDEYRQALETLRTQS